MRDIHNNLVEEVALSQQTVAADTTTQGNIIDLQDRDGCEFLIMSGTVTDGDYVPLIEAGNASDLSDAIAVSDFNLLGTEADASFAAADDNVIKKVGLKAHAGKRYVRLSIVSTGTATGGEFGAVAVIGPLHK